ncbi:hypothetical protein ThrDRAFT_04177 [Frankia casuarinae]|uniref:DUF2637 domain-containing protein n=1 Tax=Frankia casuarinae (strain DSM 45818 / CECT 9043 / HFP020203 / CcI3) TaxID=106370 RepID=Q2JGR9_FRACC|nr:MULTISPECIES: hypothetical protein [Frankia]ETA01200.1 hypothetical protein CcI6DRAFT_03323 [Frankia sp. CcI6]ABD09523.1 hypothetical protein Francci3_0129 [Frankia casuarinae]EYT90188.1 hypothetical protein ThrDRAFT_04177 [Frankia casuarinae]OAA22616.1 hypothetical protein AAY23_106256 [Frankia casuarinae]OHV52827.1 hypothetical protein CgIS1_16285 [Frankia sp. CgIS1]
MNGQSETSAASPCEDSSGSAGPAYAVKLVTTMIGIVVGLTFLFGFGNSFALGLRLGVPVFIAPLVAPAVDLSVVGLLLGTRQMALYGGPADVQRSARRLLIFASLVTLALNVAEPLIAGQYGKAAFDAVGPLLMIGWAEVGPGLIQAMQTTGARAPLPTSRTADDSYESMLMDQPPVPAQPGQDGRAEVLSADETPCRNGLGAREQDLLHRARAEDVLHWQQHQRPISAETLRKRLHVGAGTARRLVAQLRSDIHAQIEGNARSVGGEPQQAF